jgi:hypothetical protein
MKRLALLSLPLLCLSTPAISADLGPYPDRYSYTPPPPPPPIVERERIIERHYYEPAPVYTERVYVEPRAYYYAPRVYAPDEYYGRPYAYSYAGWRPHYFFPRRVFWRGHHRGW